MQFNQTPKPPENAQKTLKTSRENPWFSLLLLSHHPLRLRFCRGLGGTPCQLGRGVVVWQRLRQPRAKQVNWWNHGVKWSFSWVLHEKNMAFLYRRVYFQTTSVLWKIFQGVANNWQYIISGIIKAYLLPIGWIYIYTHIYHLSPTTY